MRMTILFSICLLLSACGGDDDHPSVCGNHIIIDADQFNSITDNQLLNILNLSIEGECLNINIGFSGCDDDHDISLVTDGAVAESFPVQIFFKLSDANPQACTAYFEKEYSYDLEDLEDLVTTEPKARLVFVGRTDEILWEIE